MKKLIVPVLLVIASCNNMPAEKTVIEVPEKAEEAMMPHETVTPKPGDKVDPICGMIKDDTWTDYSVYNNDTVWFCAAAEKKAFDKNPEKYAAKLSH